jgi:cytochrome c-type biogenesis protein CcmH/NrfG
MREGWRLYGEGRLEEAGRLVMAEAARLPDDPEAAYLLGMIFKARGEAGHAAKAFSAVERTVGSVADLTRAEMLRRLAQAHLEMLKPVSVEET